MISWPDGGAVKILTAGFDRSVGSFALTPDSKNIYLLAEEAGHEKLFTLPANGGDVRLAFEMSQGVYTNLKIPCPGFFPNVVCELGECHQSK